MRARAPLACFENLRIEYSGLVEVLHFLGMDHVTLVAAKQPSRFGLHITAGWNPLEVPEFFLSLFGKREIDEEFRRVGMNALAPAMTVFTEITAGSSGTQSTGAPFSARY